MAISRVGNSWISNHFTLRKNAATCNFCNEFFPITLKQKKYMMEHIKTVHFDDYQSTVSSESSQEDWEQFFIRQNNEIKCKYCHILIYFGTDNSCTIRKHLEVKHKVKEDTAEELCNWLRNHYNFDDRDAKQRCKYCENTIPNKIFLLLNHLIGAHKITAPSEIEPEGFFNPNFLKRKKWIREYFTTDRSPEKCCICDTSYIMLMNYSNIRRHIIFKHNEDYKRDVLSKDTNDIRNWPISKIENNQEVKCNICDNKYASTYKVNENMKKHINNIHKLDYTKANDLHIWLWYHYHTFDFQTENCKTCDNIFHEYKSSNIMIHFIKTHRINIPLHLRPTGLSKGLQDLLNSNNDADTSSGSQQLTCSLDQNSNFDNDNNSIDLSSKSSPTRLSSSLSNLFNSDDSQDVVTSSKSQQQICSFNQNSDYDYFYDQIDESSEIRTTRLLSSSSRLLNSDNNTEDITASSSYQQPTCSRYRHN